MTQKPDPAMKKLPYYHYHVPKMFIESLLKQKGDFLLHEEWSGPTRYTVSVRWGRVKQCQVRETMEGEYKLVEGSSFPSISGLIKWHVDFGEKVDDSGAKLIKPVVVEPWEVIGRECEESMKGNRPLDEGTVFSVFHIRLRKAGASEAEIVGAKVAKNWSQFDAIKKPRVRDLLCEEAKTLRALAGQTNIVQFQGIFIDTELPTILVTPVEGRSFANVMRSDGACTRALVWGAIDAAAAVAYMHEKGYIHRSLDSSKFVVRDRESSKCRPRVVLVGGFRTAKYVGEEIVCRGYSCWSCIPLAITALEALMKSVWLRQSDVWSLAVLVWQAFSHGAAPYKQLGKLSKAGLINFLKNGNRLTVPDDVPGSMATMMRSCWDKDIFKRPSALQMFNQLNQIVGQCECDHPDANWDSP